MDTQLITARTDLERMLMDESAQPCALPLSLLDEITNGFSKEKEIGMGGFAIVYKGVLGTQTVAVKKLYNVYMQEKEYQRELECLMNARHKNIVRFLGYCADTQGSVQKAATKYVLAELQQRLLCFEYVPNGSLDKHISDASGGLTWRERYRIIKGVCEGLNHLHQKHIIHLDLKPSNILMDDNMEPKIADFGLSRCLDEDQSKVLATKASGTMGYLPPEFTGRNVSRLYDIYSLGVIIMEILTGKKGYHAIDDVLDSWRNRLQESQEYDTELEQIRVCATIGNECIESNPHLRPRCVQNIIDRLKETESTDDSSSAEISPSMPTERGSLHVHRRELRFPLFDPDKLISSPLHLTNNTKEFVAFRCLPKLTESSIDGLTYLQGVLPPKSTRTFLVRLEKQPPENMESYDMILESCVAHKDLEDDPSENFLPIIRRQMGGKVHQVPLVAVFHPAGQRMTTSEPIQPQTKMICRIDPESFLVAMDVHPTEPWILVGHYDGYISLWNHETQDKLMELQIVEDTLVRYCVFIAREDWVVVGDGYGNIHVRSCKTIELDEVKRFNAHTDWIQAMAVHPSLPLLVTGCSDSLIKLWDWEKDWTCIRTFKGHAERVESLMFNPQDDTPGNITFASASLDCTVKIWNTSSPLAIATFDCKGESLTWVDYLLTGGDGQYIITGSQSGNGILWNLRTQKCVRVIKGLHTGHGCRVRVVDCLPDPPLLITSLENYDTGLCNSTTLRYKNKIHFGLGKPRNYVYVKGIRSAVIGFEGGLAMLEID